MGIIRLIIAVILIFLAAADLLSAAALSHESDFAGIFRPGGALVSAAGTDTKRVEDKMADALARLDSWKMSREREEAGPVAGNADQTELTSEQSLNLTQSNSDQINSTQAALDSGNLTSENNSTIIPPGNSSDQNSSVDLRSDASGIDANSAEETQKVGSSSEGRFKGFYGMTSSRHEIGRSDIKSRMFLSGNFEMEKTVKFQDQGID